MQRKIHLIEMFDKYNNSNNAWGILHPTPAAPAAAAGRPTPGH